MVDKAIGLVAKVHKVVCVVTVDQYATYVFEVKKSL